MTLAIIIGGKVLNGSGKVASGRGSGAQALPSPARGEVTFKVRWSHTGRTIEKRKVGLQPLMNTITPLAFSFIYILYILFV